MLTFPCFPPQYVEEYSPPKVGNGISRFISDAGLQTITSTSCKPNRFSMSLRWTWLKPGQMAEMIKFCSEEDGVNLDFESGTSEHTFSIPKSHAIWEKVPVWETVEKYWICANSLDEAQWQIVEASMPGLEANVFTWSMRVEEVLVRRAA
jgi:hypothetical protein